MATSTKDCYVRIYASQTFHPRRPQTEDLTIDVKVSISQISYDPSPTTMFKNLRTSLWSRENTVTDVSRANFCSMSKSQQRELLLKVIQHQEIPFPLENIHWSRVWPTDQQTRVSVDEAVSRLLDVARICASQQGVGRMELHIVKYEKLTLEEYNSGRARVKKPKKPLEDWFEENKDDVGAELIGKKVIFYLQRYRTDCFGLKSVMVKEESCEQDRKEPCCCPICIRVMQEGKLAIQLPCSHIFHGVCIFDWIRRKPTCPLCRFKLFDPRLLESFV